jgi:uncharacterized protein with FMN-binding domain
MPSSRAKPRRRHPARSARIGALVVSCATTGGLGYLLAADADAGTGAQSLAGLPAPVATTPATAVPVVTTQAPPVVTTATAAPGDTPIDAPSTTAPATVAAAQSGVFNGAVVNTRYGPVEIQAQITDGALTEVAVVQYPDGDRKSQRINSGALPTLRTEALTAQSANVDTVSGATYTSDGYSQSLQSALDAARSAGIALST